MNRTDWRAPLAVALAVALTASLTACQSILGIEDTTIGDGDAGQTIDAGPTIDSSLRLVSGHIGTVGPSSGGASTLRLVDHGFEYGDHKCNTAGTLCVTGGITP